MQTGAITGYIDVAQLTLYAFWLFFAGLIFYLLRENKREGYPCVSDRPNVVIEGFPRVPAPKTFLMANGPAIEAPHDEPPEVLNAVPAAKFPGAPYQPIGNPMLSGMGPGAWANRLDIHDHTYDDGLPKIVPLRDAPEFFLAWEDPDVIGYDLLGLGGERAGAIVDVWIDRSEVVVRYLEAELDGGKRVLVPMGFISIKKKLRQIRTSFITAAQFADVPTTKDPAKITLLEEDKVMAYYGGGMLYARARRTDPIL